MKKILVLTDLSVKSRAGVHFAIQLAQKTKSTLIFYHFVQLLKPMRWSAAAYKEYAEREVAKLEKMLIKYVEDGFKASNGEKPAYRCIVQHGSDITSSVVKYASKSEIDAICICTRGAGNFQKLMGTNSSRILTMARTPVFVVPSAYKNIPSKHIFYASDLLNFDDEFKRVKKVASLVHAKISIYHYDYYPNLVDKLNEIKRIKKLIAGTARLYVRELQPERPLTSHIVADVNSGASLVVMFTDRKKHWFNQLVGDNHSKEVSFVTNIPLLVMEK